MDRMSRIQTALSGIRQRFVDKDMQIASLTAARDRLQAFIDLPDWASLDGTIEAGTVVRFGALKYSARSTHTKALTRSPLNLIYWEVVTDDS